MSSKYPNTFLPILGLLFSATFWGVFWYPLRALEGQGLHGLWLTLFIFGAALCIGLVFCRQRLSQLSHPWLLLLALASGWCNASFILAILEGSIVRVLLLFYLSPLWTVIIGKVLLKETLSLTAKWTFVLALIGALVMLWDSELGIPWPQGQSDWLAISAGITFSLANVIIRKLQDVDLMVRALATWWGAFMLAVVGLFVMATPFQAVDSIVVFEAMALGAIGIVTVTLISMYGLSKLPVHRSAVIMLFELVIGAVSAHFLTNELVQPTEWIGGVMIIIAAWLATHSHIKDDRLQRGREGVKK